MQEDNINEGPLSTLFSMLSNHLGSFEQKQLKPLRQKQEEEEKKNEEEPEKKSESESELESYLTDGGEQTKAVRGKIDAFCKRLEGNKTLEEKKELLLEFSTTHLSDWIDTLKQDPIEKPTVIFYFFESSTTCPNPLIKQLEPLVKNLTQEAIKLAYMEEALSLVQHSKQLEDESNKAPEKSGGEAEQYGYQLANYKKENQALTRQLTQTHQEIQQLLLNPAFTDKNNLQLAKVQQGLTLLAEGTKVQRYEYFNPESNERVRVETREHFKLFEVNASQDSNRGKVRTWETEREKMQRITSPLQFGCLDYLVKYLCDEKIENELEQLLLKQLLYCLAMNAEDSETQEIKNNQTRKIVQHHMKFGHFPEKLKLNLNDILNPNDINKPEFKNEASDVVPRTYKFGTRCGFVHFVYDVGKYLPKISETNLAGSGQARQVIEKYAKCYELALKKEESQTQKPNHSLSSG